MKKRQEILDVKFPNYRSVYGSNTMKDNLMNLDKVSKVIVSCKTIKQVEVAKEMIRIYKVTCPNFTLANDILDGMIVTKLTQINLKSK